MCKICDRQNQWVCDCGSINRIGSKCEECGGMRSGKEESVVVFVLDDVRPNRATRRAATRPRRN
jgi:hypothetical protein